MKYSWLLALVCLLVTGIAAQKDNGLYLNLSSNSIQGKGNANLSNEMMICLADKKLTGIRKGAPVELMVYAKNNRAPHIFELTEGNFQPLKLTMRENKKGSQVLLFAASYDDLFGVAPRYRWTWQARAEPPASPLAAVQGKKVTSLQLWYTLTIDGKTYTSSRRTLKVLP